MGKGSERLARSAERLRLIAGENPCGWGDAVLGVIADSIDAMVSERTKSGVTLIDLAEYYKVSIRTIQRWRATYDDFPDPIDPYAKTLSFPTDKVVEWKVRHIELVG